MISFNDFKSKKTSGVVSPENLDFHKPNVMLNNR